MADGTMVFSVPQEDLDATGRVILEAGRWCKTFYADGPWRPRGKWIPSVDRWGDIITTVDGYTCSECGSFNTDKDNFCPNCGADMREEEQDERPN